MEEAGECPAIPMKEQAEESQDILRLNLLHHQVDRTREIETDVAMGMTKEALETREATRGDLVPL
mgnify:FL=1